MDRFQLKTAISWSTAQEQKFRQNFTISGPKKADGPETARFHLKTAIFGLQHKSRNSGRWVPFPIKNCHF